MKKLETFALLVMTTVIIAGISVAFYVSDASNVVSNDQTLGNVSVIGDVQIIDIGARGGYSPRLTAAKAGTQSLIRVTTRNTFDCSSALMIPSLGVNINLAPSGVKEFTVPPQEPGTKIQGLCSMGMYSFTIVFN